MRRRNAAAFMAALALAAGNEDLAVGYAAELAMLVAFAQPEQRRGSVTA